MDPATALHAGISALQRGDAQAARAAFDAIDAAGRGTHQMRLLLAQACTILGDGPAAHRALDAVLAAEPTNLYALIMRGDLLAGRGDARAAVSWYQAALKQAPRARRLPADLLAMLRRAETAVARSGSVFETHLDQHMREDGIVPSTAGPRFTEALEILAGRAEVQLQQPTSFYYPGLPQRAFFERDEFAWAPALEGKATAIRTELEAVIADKGALTPYVTAEENRPAKRHPLLADPRWSALHLYRNGSPVSENVARFPATIAALDGLPIPHIAGRSPMVLFSALRPGTHIPPHHGMLNTRLICHLPLIVPAGCSLRVGNHKRAVEQGRMMIFDDTIEHEAWNESDGLRVVLLFEIWHPELGADERAALTSLYQAIGAYGATGEDQVSA
ncbi:MULTISPECIES: aspartyl/asparaginyl beta-hydroxylase domain-containing protein [unclassified Novosphingobium]|uniref:aspartyl/asparaginyl beta-hydroxylase domain-containing protein n=1 Tax=unclassified Novosphingobium TaxID=2644732 RepID=UPI00135CDBC3|nr:MULTISPECIES: aspartyl/asparaginyl beta-hydroxylase domain-containing protein [unclassified Novosphingobium]